MASIEPHAGPRTDTRAASAGPQRSVSSEPPAWPSHDLIRLNAGTGVDERAGVVRPGPLPGSTVTDAAAIAAAIRAAELEAATADVTAAEIEAAEAAAAELAAAELGEEIDEELDGAEAAAAIEPDDSTAAPEDDGAEVLTAAAAAGQTTTRTAPKPAAPLDAEPRRPTKFMADLTAAMRAAAEAARETTISQLRVDAAAEVETIRTESTLYAASRREQAEEDVAGIREWSKAEIARIRAETEENIASRRLRLDQEMVDQAARLEAGVGNVQLSVAAFEEHMAQFFERLLEEEDPSHFATMAGQLPEPPRFVAWSPEPEPWPGASVPRDSIAVPSPQSRPPTQRRSRPPPRR